MSTRTLRWISALLPMGFMVGVLYWRFNLVSPERTMEGNLYALLAVALGAVIFSVLVFSVIERREEEIELRSEQLEALHEAALALTTELDIQAVLQKVVDLSRSLIHSQYGALGVLEPGTQRIEQFITSGLTPEQHSRIGDPPTGHGLLGVLIDPQGEPLLVNDIGQDPRSAGFPLNHPPMQSLVGVPIRSKGEVFGNLYLADKIDINAIDGDQLINFEDSDRLLLEKFATQAAIAIENAQLYRQTLELTVLKERERFSMDLHDGIMQAVYATGLSLQEAEHSVEGQPDSARERIQQATADLGQVQRDIRNYILGLRPDRDQGQDLVAGIDLMARELRANTLLEVSFEHPRKQHMPSLDEKQVSEILHIVRETLANIRKHAHARHISLILTVGDDELVLKISDDGHGFDPRTASQDGGHGLLNIRQRAQSLGAQLLIASQPAQGTHIELNLPLKPAQEAR
jgi:signal transduction histidine kinase